MSEEIMEATQDTTSDDRPVAAKRVRDVYGGGKWDAGTGRYVPVGGGSRTRVFVADDKHIPRYAGMLGVDPQQGTNIATMGALYSHLGGMSVVKQGAPKFLAEIAERKPVIKVEAEDGLTEL